MKQEKLNKIRYRIECEDLRTRDAWALLVEVERLKDKESKRKARKAAKQAAKIDGMISTGRDLGGSCVPNIQPDHGS